jgi:hypothetical protein
MMNKIFFELGHANPVKMTFDKGRIIQKGTTTGEVVY